MNPIARLMSAGPTTMMPRYSLKRRTQLRGRSTRHTKLKLVSTFWAIDSALTSNKTTLTLASVES